ncbi:MAG: hypothetical protein JEZ08_25520 [Clostridiales bacterium]|nr:hypothetical protein [Clostridiales bacterium]
MKKIIIKTVFVVSIICVTVINTYSDKNTVTNILDLSNLSRISLANSGEQDPFGKDSDCEVGYKMGFESDCYICMPCSSICNVSDQCCKSWGNCPG